MRAAVILLCLCTAAAAGVDPATLAITNRRGEPIVYLTNVVYVKGDVLLLTNCTAYAAAGATQDLAGVTLTATIGDPTATATATGTVISATDGTWAAAATIPRLPASWARIQIRLSDGTNAYTYPDKLIPVRDRM